MSSACPLRVLCVLSAGRNRRLNKVGGRKGVNHKNASQTILKMRIQVTNIEIAMIRGWSEEGESPTNMRETVRKCTEKWSL